MRFAGTERVTIEVDGTFDPATLALPAGLAHDGGRVSLFAFHVDALRIVGMPLVRSSYAEVLWRIAVRDGERAAWWVAACDLAARMPRFAARRWVKYPVRENPVDVAHGVRIGDTFAFTLGAEREPAIVEQRALLTGALYEVPWGDDANGARTADVRDLTDALGQLTVGSPVRWSSTAIVRHGRQHRCGSASKVVWYKDNRN